MTTSSLFDSIAADVEAASPSNAKQTVSPVRRRRLSGTEAPHADALHAAREALAVTPLAMDMPSDRVGSIVWWSADAIVVNAVDLWSALRASDDDSADDAPRFADLVKEPATPAMAITRAASRRQSVLKTDGLRWHDLGTADDGSTVVALGREDKDANAGEWSGHRVLTVSVSARGVVSRPTNVSDEDDERIDAMLARYEVERGNLTASDLGPIMTAALMDRLGGVRVKAGGGVYFVPRGKDESLGRLASALSLAGITLMSVPAGKEQSASLATFATVSLLDDVKRITAAATAAEAKATEAFVTGETRKVPTMGAQIARLEEIRALRDRAETLRVLLGSLDIDMATAIDAATKATRATLELLPMCSL